MLKGLLSIEAVVGVNGPEVGEDGPEEPEAIEELGERCDGRSMDGSDRMFSG